MSISVSPNPAQTYLDIKATENIRIKECLLINGLGQIIQKEMFNCVNTAHLILNKTSNGIYFLKIATSDGLSILKKVIISH